MKSQVLPDRSGPGQGIPMLRTWAWELLTASLMHVYNPIMKLMLSHNTVRRGNRELHLLL